MAVADGRKYLSEITGILNKCWPDNRAVNIVCHGHSVPAGYFATPMIDTFNAYPHLLYKSLKERFPFAVLNVIVTAIGGETSEAGAERFEKEVLCHRPDVLTLDYGLNDRGIGLEKARATWSGMIETSLERSVKVILLTPTHDTTQLEGAPAQDKAQLEQHAEQIRELAGRYGVGLADSFLAFWEYRRAGDLSDILSWANHPNRAGHELVARELLRWFPAF